METKTWLKDTFSIDSIPTWSCPSCHNGFLELLSDQFNSEETSSSKKQHSDEYWEPEFIKTRFHGALKCKSCEDIIMFIGRGYVNIDHHYDEDIGDVVDNYKDIYLPEFFFPPLNIIQIPEKCPEGIKKEIYASFGYFWNDLSSCANKIRVSLELLMNHLKIKKTTIRKGKRRKITLHERLGIFKQSQPEIAEFLLAIKWIGNVGSHSGKLEKIDILEAYELLDYSLKRIFLKNEDKLKKITKEINKRKGVRRRKN